MSLGTSQNKLEELEKCISDAEANLTDQEDDLVKLWLAQVQMNLEELDEKIQAKKKSIQKAKRIQKQSLYFLILLLVITYIYFSFFHNSMF